MLVNTIYLSPDMARLKHGVLQSQERRCWHFCTTRRLDLALAFLVFAALAARPRPALGPLGLSRLGLLAGCTVPLALRDMATSGGL